jgi:hypothetical protein
MRLHLSLLLGLTLGLVSHAHGDEPAPVRRVALLVGVNEYLKPGFRDLEFAEADVTSVAKELEQLGFEVRVLLGSGRGAEQATLTNIEAAARAMVEPLSKDDIALVREARDAVERATSDVAVEPNRLIVLAAMHALAGDLPRAREVLQDLDDQRRQEVDVAIEAYYVTGLAGRRQYDQAWSIARLDQRLGLIEAVLEQGEVSRAESWAGELSSPERELAWDRIISRRFERESIPDVMPLIRRLLEVPVRSGEGLIRLIQLAERADQYGDIALIAQAEQLVTEHHAAAPTNNAWLALAYILHLQREPTVELPAPPADVSADTLLSSLQLIAWKLRIGIDLRRRLDRGRVR